MNDATARRAATRRAARVATGLAMAAMLAGCTAPTKARWHDPVSVSPTVTHTDVADCYDGDCDIHVTGSARVPLDPQFGISVLRIRIVPPRTVRIDAQYATGGSGHVTMTDPGRATLNGLTIIIVAIDGETADLRFTSR